MRKVIAALTLVIAVGAAAVLIVEIVSRRAEGAANATLAAIEPPAQFAARYPKIAQKNESSARLELLMRPFGLSFNEGAEAGPADAQGHEIWAIAGDWLNEQRDLPDDTIKPLPSELDSWLAEREASLADVIQHLRTQPAPQWPIVLPPLPEDLTALPEIPSNQALFAQMRLIRLLNVAALREEARGNHARAWEIEEAAWKQVSGLYDRPEMLSRMISIAGLRLIAASARKLEAPAPAWLGTMDALRVRAAVLDSTRHDFIGAEERFARIREQLLRRQWHRSVSAVIVDPMERWTWAEVVDTTTRELHRLSLADPCAMDLQTMPERMRADVTPLARHHITMQSDNLIDVFARAAAAEIDIDGTVRVLEAKRAIASGRPVPHAAASPCKEGQWVFESAGGVDRIRFTGSRPASKRIGAFDVPTEFVFRKST